MARPMPRMCLPTGSTPRPIYAEVARRSDFSSAKVFILDEFGLPPGDPARCDSMLQRDLLDLLDPPPARVEGLDPQAEDLEAECRRFSAVVMGGGLDLTLLGLGANGHLGLNEPGSDADSPTRVVALSEATRRSLVRYEAESDTNWGMTLGMRELLASDEIWLLVRGAHKAEILARFRTTPPTPALPATFLKTHDNVVIWADEAAMNVKRE